MILFAALALLATAAPARAAEPPPIASDAETAPGDELAVLLKQIEAAYREGRYSEGLALVKKAFELKQNDVSSMDRIGSVYYVLGRYGEAVTVWTRALPLERDAKRRRELENSLRVARRELGLADEEALAASTAPPRASTVAAAAPRQPQARKLTAAEKAQVQALYKAGVKYYATGQYLQAATAFLDMLDLDPGNADAAKALKRLQLDR